MFVLTLPACSTNVLQAQSNVDVNNFLTCIFRAAGMPKPIGGEDPSGGDAALFRASGCAMGGNGF